ncbi:hypothetical protein GCM10025868_02840 [Angustibacter aerolatus]|uniref:Aminoglycoside phosphotransferase domain-containing protein n=1 Tax=Angustibacter aerolatus TaxID=1162965 RepID=A0ABQ6JB63_9ACTN|nr:hypothetical protein GCM10025868_02840 [Angustibacter aerolatus]
MLHDPQPALGGFSGETFAGQWFRERAFVRLYLRDPSRAVVDLGVRRRLTGSVPQARLLAAEPRPVDGLPPHLVTAAVPGVRGDLLLERGPRCRRRPRSAGRLARLVTVLRETRVDGAGPFVDGALAVGEWPAPLSTLSAWARHLEPDLAAAGLGPRSAPGLLAALDAASVRLQHAPSGPPSLVHGDLNPKNLVVDPDTGRLRAVLDWEHAHGGRRLEDVGNLLRAVDQGLHLAEQAPLPRGATSRADVVRSWEALRHGLVDGLHEGLLVGGTGRAPGSEDWLRQAADADLFALLEPGRPPGSRARRAGARGPGPRLAAAPGRRARPRARRRLRRPRGGWPDRVAWRVRTSCAAHAPRPRLPVRIGAPTT